MIDQLKDLIHLNEMESAMELMRGYNYTKVHEQISDTPLPVWLDILLIVISALLISTVTVLLYYLYKYDGDCKKIFGIGQPRANVQRSVLSGRTRPSSKTKKDRKTSVKKQEVPEAFNDEDLNMAI